MNKKIALAAAAAVALPIAVPAAAMADSEDHGAVQQIPSLAAAFRTWDYGGAQVGGGAAKLLSGAVIGVPQLVTDLPCELVGSNGPAACEYVEGDTDLGGPLIPAGN
jgi:hypothetical protein